MKKVLVVKTSSLGDVVQSLGVVDYLRRRQGVERVDWVAEEFCTPLLNAHPNIHRVIPIRSKQWRRLRDWAGFRSFKEQLRLETYDRVFDLQGNMKSAVVTVLARSSLKVGWAWSQVAEWPNTLFTHQRFEVPRGRSIREDYLALVQASYGDAVPFEPEALTFQLSPMERDTIEGLMRTYRDLPRPWTLVAPSSAWKNKELSEEYLLQVLDSESTGTPFFCWGSLEERNRAQSLLSDSQVSGQLLPKLSLAELQAWMQQVDLFIGMDSLPLHLCGTTNTPTLSFFGPSLASKYGLRGSQHRTIQGHCPYGEQFDKRCSKLRSCSTGACLKDLKQFQKSP